MQWTACEPEFNIRVLQISNCYLSDKDLSFLLKGISCQHKIISLNLQIQELDHLSIDPLLEILSHKFAKALQELQICGLRRASSDVVTSLCDFLAKSGSLSKLTLSDSQLFAN